MLKIIRKNSQDTFRGEEGTRSGVLTEFKILAMCGDTTEHGVEMVLFFPRKTSNKRKLVKCARASQSRSWQIHHE